MGPSDRGRGTLRRRLEVLALVGVVVLLDVACRSETTPAPTATGTPQRGGVLIMGSTADVDSWNPYLSQQAFATDVLRRIMLPLAVELPATDSEPAFSQRLAESWTFSDDRKSLTFFLRDLSWSDGQPVTAADVRFTWTAQTSPDVPWIDAGRKSRIRDVIVVDPRSVRFEFETAYPGQLADAVEGLILPEHRYAAIPFAEWATHPWTSIDIGSGPFLLERHDPGHQIVLKRNPTYAGKEPWLDQVVVKIIPDIANLVTQLRAGQIDYVEGVPPRDAASLEKADGITLTAFDFPSYDYLGWNGSRPPLDDPRLRRALTLAIDRQGLVEDMLYGFGRVSLGPVISSWWAADRDLDPWPYDTDEAGRILRELGYRSDTNPLKLTLLTNHGNDLRTRMLVKIQQDLAQVGVQVELRPLEMGAMRQQIASGAYDGYLGGWVYTLNDLASVFHSSAEFPQGANMVGYRSAEADAALDRANAAATRETMAQALKQFQRTVHEDQPYTFLYEKLRLAAHGPRVHGLHIDAPADPLAVLEGVWLR